jgi:high-affinity iron transporter
VLGIQPFPDWAMVTGWLVYVIPMTAVVLWPGRRRRTGTRHPAAEPAQVKAG